MNHSNNEDKKNDKNDNNFNKSIKFKDNVGTPLYQSIFNLI